MTFTSPGTRRGVIGTCANSAYGKLTPSLRLRKRSAKKPPNQNTLKEVNTANFDLDLLSLSNVSIAVLDKESIEKTCLGNLY